METPTPAPSVLVLLGNLDWWYPAAWEIPPNGEIQITPLDLWVTLQIEGKDVNLLLDMGAAFSVLPFWLGPLVSLNKMVMGVDGKPQSWNFTKPLHCKVGNW